MRNTAKVRTLERLFPLLAVENGCIISKEADLTVAFKVELPELFTITEEEYEQIHSTWSKAIKVLPVYSIVHKQDWYTTETYRAEHLGNAQMSFLDRSSERHFNERPYLNHDCYLYLTKTTRQRMAQKSDFSSLVQGRLVPKEMTDKERISAFLDAVDQFERIVNDSGLFSIARLTEEELLGKDNERGLLDRYLSLERDKSASLEDLSLRAREGVQTEHLVAYSHLFST